jgi:hypothetical protein
VPNNSTRAPKSNISNALINAKKNVFDIKEEDESDLLRGIKDENFDDKSKKSVKHEMEEIRKDDDIEEKVKKILKIVKKEDEEDDDAPVFRNKNKELREDLKAQLSNDVVEAINIENDEMEVIIEKLRARGLSKDKAIEMVKTIGTPTKSRENGGRGV